MKKLLTFLTLLTLFFTTAWAAETAYYTLNGNITGGNNGYDFESTISQEGMTWKVTGNTVEKPWRIGGKSLNNVDRTVYSTTAMGSAISKVSLSVGSASSITVNSLKLSVYSDAAMTTRIDEVSRTFSANSIINFTPSSGTEWTSGAYYKFTFNVTVSASKNKYIEFNSAVFYKNEASVVSAPTFSPAGGNYDEPQNVTISTTTDGATIYYTTDDSDPTTSSSVYSSPIAVSTTTTIKAIAVKSGMTSSSVASATYKFPTTVTPTYEEDFSGGFSDFYTKTVTDPGFNVWTTGVYQGKTYAKASGYSGGTTAAQSWLISPYIDLTNASNPELSFSQAIDNHFGTIADEATLWVKENNATTWTQITINYPDAPTTGYTAFESQTINLSGYKNKIIQIAFKYISTTSNAGNWEVSDFKVKDSNPSAPSYYLVGSFNSWTESDACKFEESNGTYTLNNVTFDDANTTFKVIKIENGNKTWYGGTGGVDYNIHHTHHENLPMDGSQNYKIQSAGTTSFSFTVSNNTPGNLNVNREAKLYIKGDFNSWNEELMTATADGWTTSQTIAANNKFGFVDEFGQYRGKEWTIWSEHMNNGYEIPMETNGDYKMGIAGTYTLNVNSNLSKLFVNSVTGDVYTLVESAEDLVDGAQFVIMSKGLPTQGAAYAMAGQRNNNRAQTADPIAINSDKQIIINGQLDAEGNPVQVITLEGQTDAWYFNVGNGYLYASGSGNNNQLKTEAEIDEEDNAKATIVIDADAKSAAITFQGTSTNKYLRHNASSKLFACYGSAGSQQPVYLFKKGASITPPSDQVATPAITPGSANSSSPYTVYGGKQEITITCATDGATIYYTTNGDDPTTSSTSYAEPCYLTSNGGPMTVKAIAVKDGLDDSQIATSYYLFTSPAAPTFDPASGTVRTEAFDVTISSEYDDAEIYYMLDPESAPTANVLSTSGTPYENPVNVSGEGSHTIYAMVVRNDIKSNVVNATYTITSGGQPSGDGDYVKVTNAADLTDGEYLIVYEMEGTPIENGIVFDGSLSNLDTKPNSISEVVEINNFTIASSTEVDAAIFTITSSENGYSIKSASDKYIGGTSGSNTMTSSDDVIYNSISFDEDGNADIISNTSHLRYNTSDTRFRYFKSSSYASQQPIALYKKVENPVDEPTSVTLAELCATGVKDNSYMITDQLLAVEYGESEEGEGDDKVGYSYLWCKDLGNKSIFATSIHKGDQVDFLMDEDGIQTKAWDQSNWIALRFKEPTQSEGGALRNAVGSYINAQTIKGVLVDDNNYMLEVSDNTIATTACDEPYTKNTYCTSNFVLDNLNIFGSIENGDGAYTGTNNPQNYFFMNPKVQEACFIAYAMWDADKGYFTVPTNSGFVGRLDVDLTYNTNPNINLNEALTHKQIYQFNAIVKRSTKNAYMKADESPIAVYPTDLDGGSGNNPPTAISTVNVNGEIKSVKFYNVAGIESNVPFQGVNIVVTEYTDGSRTTTKMLKR